MSFVCGEHGRHSKRDSYLADIIRMMAYGCLDSSLKLDAVLFRQEPDVYLAFICVAVRKRDKDTPAAFFCGHVDSMVCIAVGSAGRKESVGSLRMRFYMMPANLAAEVAVELFFRFCRQADGKLLISSADFRRELPFFRRSLHESALESVIGF